MSSTVKPLGAVRSRPVAPPRTSRIAHRAGQWILQAWQAYTTRQALAQLDDRALHDLGISRAQAQFEAGRPFWDTTGPVSRR